jgi:hypothetical protein
MIMPIHTNTPTVILTHMGMIIHMIMNTITNIPMNTAMGIATITSIPMDMTTHTIMVMGAAI